MGIPNVVDLGGRCNEHPVDADESYSGFDETSGGEKAVAVFVAAVAIARSAGLAIEFEGIFDGG